MYDHCFLFSECFVDVFKKVILNGKNAQLHVVTCPLLLSLLLFIQFILSFTQ